MKQTACPENCPGCGYKNRTYAEVFEQKVNFAKQKLSKWDYFIESFQDQPKEIIHYRRKVTLHARFFETWNIGLLKNDNIINIPHCPIQAQIINESIALALHFFPDYKYFPLIYWVQSNQQIVWVLKTNQLPDMDWLNSDLTQALSGIGIEGISLHLNPSAGKKVFLKDRLIPVFGKSFSIDDQQMQYGPLSFQQQIQGFTAKPIEIASQYFKKHNINAVIDLYCGLGKSLKIWNNYQWLNLGVELSNEACKFAEINNPNSIIL